MEEVGATLDGGEVETVRAVLLQAQTDWYAPVSQPVNQLVKQVHWPLRYSIIRSHNQKRDHYLFNQSLHQSTIGICRSLTQSVT